MVPLSLVASAALVATGPAILDRREVQPHAWEKKLDKLAPVDLRDAIENHTEASPACLTGADGSALAVD